MSSVGSRRCRVAMVQPAEAFEAQQCVCHQQAVVLGIRPGVDSDTAVEHFTFYYPLAFLRLVIRCSTVVSSLGHRNLS